MKDVIYPIPSGNIAEVVSGDERFSTLLAAVGAAGLADTLATAGPFTVFAPTNEAFAKVPQDVLDGLLADKEALTKVPLRHVVPGTTKDCSYQHILTQLVELQRTELEP